jgi:hypothetical protein
MGIAYVYERRTAFAAGTLLMLSLSLGGCATSTGGSSLMDARAEAPVPPKTSAYLPVEDLPAQREKLQNELIAARDRQAAAGKAQGAALAEPVKP